MCGRAGEIKRAGPQQPLWPGCKPQQLHAGNTQSYQMLSIPDSQASSLLPFLTRTGGQEGTGTVLGCSELLEDSVCREGNNQILKQGLDTKRDLHAGLTLIPGWDKPRGCHRECCTAVLWFILYLWVEKPKIRIAPVFLLGLE